MPDSGGEATTSMQRRDFLKSSVALALLLNFPLTKAHGFVPAHNWGKGIPL